jgi:phage tail-like protein
MATATPAVQFEASAFRVSIDGIAVSGVTRISGLRRSTAVVRPSAGGDPAAAAKPVPGVTTFRPLTLWRPKTLDSAFDDWAAIASKPVAERDADRHNAAHDLHRELVIELLSAAGRPLISYRVLNCWPSRYDAFQELLAGSNTLQMERLTLQHEGWVTEVLAD